MFMLSSNNSGAFPFYLQIDLGEVKSIEAVRIFNFNFTQNGTSYVSRGIRNFRLYVSSGDEWQTSVGRIAAHYRRVLSATLPMASGKATEPGTLFTLDAPVNARFVAIVADDDWDATKDNLNYNGLSEVVLFGGDAQGGAAESIPAWTPGGILLEAESFADKGGWSIDPQFSDAMGSPFLLAHGLGTPVADATAQVDFTGAGGSVRAWVRTRDWVPDWEGDNSTRPGRFHLRVCGAESDDLGVSPAEWGWVDAGLFEVPDATGEVVLHDLAGFEGRCDAVWLAPENAAPPPDGGAALSAWRAAMRGEEGPPDDVVEADFVVVGGGIAGTCAAVAAADAGLSVALWCDDETLPFNIALPFRAASARDLFGAPLDAAAPLPISQSPLFLEIDGNADLSALSSQLTSALPPKSAMRKRERQPAPPPLDIWPEGKAPSGAPQDAPAWKPFGAPLGRKGTAPANDCAATLRLQYSADALTVEVEIIDDEHRQANVRDDPSQIWAHDSIQIGLDLDFGKPWEAGFAGAGNSQTLGGHRVFKFGVGGDGGGKGVAYLERSWDDSLPSGTVRHAVDARVERDDAAARTRYRVRIPWAQIGAAGRPPRPGEAIGFAIAVNDIDPERGAARHGLALFGGIVHDKEPKLFGEALIR